MFENIIKYLHEKNKSVLTFLIFQSNEDYDWKSYFNCNESLLRSALKIDDNIFVEKNTSTATKIRLLRKLFVLYKLDPMDLIFYLKDTKSNRFSESRFNTRKKYWEYAIPRLQYETMHRGTFNTANPTSSNMLSGSFGIGGIGIQCIANMNEARVEFLFLKVISKRINQFLIAYIVIEWRLKMSLEFI